jgi:2-keto-3-deoxy-6-phosphogluconate aldolase
MREVDKLRAVVDAIAEGGVRALEITMSVPGAVDLIRQIAPTLPSDFVFGAGRCSTPTPWRGWWTPARGSSSAPSSGGR